MSYITVPMFAPAGEVNAEELSVRADRELAPQLFKVGCQRYNTVKFANGHLGATILYPDMAAYEQGIPLATEWVKSLGTISATPVRRLRGEIVFVHNPQANGSLANTFGTIRVYRSTASVDDVKQALEQEAMPIPKNAPGLLRYALFQTDDGFAAITAQASREAGAQLTARAREAVERSGSRLARVFPEPPEVIEGEIIHTFTP